MRSHPTGVHALACIPLLASGFWLLASHAYAQYRSDLSGDAGPAIVPNPAIVDKSGATLPLNLEFTDSTGKTAPLSTFFHHGGKGRPVILTLVYFSCPSICGLTQDSLMGAVRQGPRELQLGKDYDILIVSIDPDDTPALAAIKRKNYLAKVPLPESQPGLTYLTGGEANIKQLADTVGFGFRRQFEGDKFLHSAGIFICTPDGRVSQTILNVQYEPDQLHNALRLASNGTIGSGLLGIGLSCGAMHYNPLTGRYEQNPWFYTGVAAALASLIFVITMLSILWHNEFKKNKHPFTPPPPSTNCTN
ncbi:MAG: SCO family protein [Phycisphaerales bacterium]|nr:SCO family protein [Phycisphaerales bacterium]